MVILTAENSQKIRLWGIDAPEKTQDFDQKAKENLSNLVFGKEVKVDIKRKDRYGRHVGKIYAQNVLKPRKIETTKHTKNLTTNLTNLHE